MTKKVHATQASIRQLRSRIESITKDATSALKALKIAAHAASESKALIQHLASQRGIAQDQSKIAVLRQRTYTISLELSNLQATTTATTTSTKGSITTKERKIKLGKEALSLQKQEASLLRGIQHMRPNPNPNPNPNWRRLSYVGFSI